MFVFLLLIIILILITCYKLGGNRENLPYREIIECYIFYKGKILAAKYKTYIKFPGGGIEEGEPVDAGKRELLEEVGIICNDLKIIDTVCWDWFPEWADNEKRKKRYEQFRGEKVYFAVGTAEEFTDPTNADNDAWFKSADEISNYFHDIKDLIKLHKKLSKKDHPNTKPYREKQLKMLNYFN